MKLWAVLLPIAIGPIAVPDGIPPLPEDGAVCNASRTHCLVNFDDWMALQMAITMQAQQITNLKQQVKTVQCASVEVLEPPRR